jgi:drug/metabolite transporter (DMT)-like permease
MYLEDIMYKGFIYAVVSAVFFGSAGIFIKQGFEQELSPVELLIIQYILASLMLFILCVMKHRKELRISGTMLKKLLIQGVVGNTLMTIFLYSSMAYLDVAVATMLLYTYPAMVAAFSFFHRGERVSVIKTAAIVGTFIGCLMVLNIWSVKQGSLSFIGVLFGILSAVFYSFMNIYAEGIVEDTPPLVITFYTTIFSLAALLIFNTKFIFRISTLHFDVFMNAGMLAFFCEIIPLTLLYAAIKQIGPVKTSIISTLELPVSAIVSFALIGEVLLPMQFAGIILVLFSIIALRREKFPE